MGCEWLETLEASTFEGVAMVIWAAWEARNSSEFQGKEAGVSESIARALSLLKEFKRNGKM